VAAVSAILLFVSMFFDWFGVRFSEQSNRLLTTINYFPVPGKNAWEALDFIPIALVIAVAAVLGMVSQRLIDPYEPPFRANRAIAVLGIVSMVLVLFRIIDPPDFGSAGAATEEGTVLLPIFVALAAAAGIGFGGCLAMWEETAREPSTAGA
jgi:hypothetical protein